MNYYRELQQHERKKLPPGTEKFSIARYEWVSVSGETAGGVDLDRFRVKVDFGTVATKKIKGLQSLLKLRLGRIIELKKNLKVQEGQISEMKRLLLEAREFVAATVPPARDTVTRHLPAYDAVPTEFEYPASGRLQNLAQSMMINDHRQRQLKDDLQQARIEAHRLRREMEDDDIPF